MRARPRRLAIAAAAVTAASLPLWASTAGAGGELDEQNQSTRTVTVNGVACQVRLYSQRYTTDVYASTEVVTTAEQCRTDQVNVLAVFTTEHGDTVSAAAGDNGPTAGVTGSGAADLVRSNHFVTFVDGTSVSYTLSSK